MVDRGEWLTTTEAAARLGVTLHRLRQLIERGELPAYRFDRRVIRIRVSDVGRLMKESSQ